MPQNLWERISTSAREALSLLKLPFVAPRSFFNVAKSLPRRFSLTLAAVALLHFPLATMLSAVFVLYVVRTFVTLPDEKEPLPAHLLHLTVTTAVIFGLLTLTLFLTLFIFLGVVGIVQAVLWPGPPLRRLRIHGPPRREATPERDDNPLAGYYKIGVILAGGGAKGAYQAGALKAVHEFVVRHGARDRVKMIAGTSIGAWNALFWLADLIESPDGGPGLLEQWWSQICVPGVIRPAFYMPFYRNFLLSDAPWRDTFEKIFGASNPGARERLLGHVRSTEEGMTFYFTKSNVSQGRLDYATNRGDFDEDAKARAYPVRDLEGLRAAVFCSMGIPPLFNYTEDETGVYEDGGVVNNLPIRFGTELEECDLLFVLPLNATFAEPEVNRRSLSKRLMRVMDIRQGVLERNALKMVKLYNQLASLREEVERLRPRQERGGGASTSVCADHALSRGNGLVRVFCICPKPAKPIINTMEFWNVDGARRAFELMYEATRKELEEHFHERVNTSSGGVCMVQVDENGRVECTEKF
jgi:NTE family protein